MKQLNEITDQMSMEELMEVKGGSAAKNICIFNPAVVVKCDSGAVKSDDLKKEVDD